MSTCALSECTECVVHTTQQATGYAGETTLMAAPTLSLFLGLHLENTGQNSAPQAHFGFQFFHPKVVAE